jgi:hypothetical protein
MATEAWEVKLSRIFAGYLSDAPAIAAGLPAVVDVPRYDMENEGELVRPSIEVMAARLPGSHPRLVQVQVDMVVRTMGPDGDGDGGTLPATAALWAQKVRGHVSDVSAFVAYLVTSLSVEERTGWRTLRLRLLNAGEVDLDAETRARDEKVGVLVWLEISGE